MVGPNENRCSYLSRHWQKAKTPLRPDLGLNLHSIHLNLPTDPETTPIVEKAPFFACLFGEFNKIFRGEAGFSQRESESMPFPGSITGVVSHPDPKNPHLILPGSRFTSLLQGTPTHETCGTHLPPPHATTKPSSSKYAKVVLVPSKLLVLSLAEWTRWKGG